jgi:iron complex transport system substrate-binding protein
MVSGGRRTADCDLAERVSGVLGAIRALRVRTPGKSASNLCGPSPSAARRPPFTRGVLLALIAASAAAAAETPRPAQRIVSLAPHLTELAFSAGAGDRVVGTVEYSDHPEAARKIPRIGDAFRVDLERVLALRPDAVIAWESGTPVQTIERMRALGLTVTAIATRRLPDVAGALRVIGQIGGAQEEAARAAAQFEMRIAALRAEYRGRSPVSVFVQINDRPIYTINEGHIMSEVVELCGGRNVFADLNTLAPIVSIEAVIAANPQVILATDDAAPDAPAQWRRWSHIDAVQKGNVYMISSDHVARATMRLADGAREVCRTLDAARARLGSAKGGVSR